MKRNKAEKGSRKTTPPCGHPSRGGDLVPCIRFPEFRDKDGWEEESIGELFEFLPTANNSRADLSSDGDVFYIHYGDIHTKFNTYIDFESSIIPKISSSLYKNAALLKKGDWVIADASEDTVGIAKSIEVKGLKKGVKAISGFHTILLREKQNKYVNGFKGLLRDIATVNKQIQRLTVGVKVYSVSKNVLKQVLLPLPSLSEQQKIADCLSSLDELIAAHVSKRDALVTFKKGLMRELFPAEGEHHPAPSGHPSRGGELIPRLRFPEFAGEQEWDEKTLGDVAEFINGRAFSQEELLDSGKYPVLRVGNFFNNGNWYYSDLELEDSKFCNNGDLLFAWSASFGPKIWKGSKTIYHYHIWKVNNDSGKIVKSFLYHFLNFETEKIGNASSSGATMLHITKESIEKWQIEFPTITEQQMISDCLSSLDNLIAAQTQKIEELKAHKKGLMQQLFPSIGGVAGEA
jgi:restriction endonuclease S subunit